LDVTFAAKPQSCNPEYQIHNCVLHYHNHRCRIQGDSWLRIGLYKKLNPTHSSDWMFQILSTNEQQNLFTNPPTQKLVDCSVPFYRDGKSVVSKNLRCF